MYSEQQAKEIFLEYINSPEVIGTPKEFVVYAIRRSEKEDYWIISANAKPGCPQSGGVYGYLVDVVSGEVIVVGPDGIGAYLKDKYDLEEANGREYVLSYAHEPNDKKAIVNLRKVLSINYPMAVVYARNKRQWFKGRKRYLEGAQELLREKDIRSEIKLVEKSDALFSLEQTVWWWSEIEKMFATESMT